MAAIKGIVISHRCIAMVISLNFGFYGDQQRLQYLSKTLMSATLIFV